MKINNIMFLMLFLFSFNLVFANIEDDLKTGREFYFYPNNESNILIDEIGNYNGTAYNGVFFSDDEDDRYFHCDGVNDYIQIIKPTSYPFTLSFWINVPNVMQSSKFIVTVTTQNTFEIHNAFFRATKNGNSALHSSNSNNVWYHLVMVFTNESVELIRNDVSAIKYFNNTMSSSDIFLCSYSASSLFSNVKIKNMQMWNRTLNNTEISYIYSKDKDYNFVPPKIIINDISLDNYKIYENISKDVKLKVVGNSENYNLNCSIFSNNNLLNNTILFFNGSIFTSFYNLNGSQKINDVINISCFANNEIYTGNITFTKLIIVEEKTINPALYDIKKNPEFVMMLFIGILSFIFMGLLFLSFIFKNIVTNILACFILIFIGFLVLNFSQIFGFILIFGGFMILVISLVLELNR